MSLSGFRSCVIYLFILSLQQRVVLLEQKVTAHKMTGGPDWGARACFIFCMSFFQKP